MVRGGINTSNSFLNWEPLGVKGSMNQTVQSSWWWVAADKRADRNTSVQLERFWGSETLAGFHRIRYAQESRPDRMGFVIPIAWKYMTRPTVEIIYATNIRILSATLSCSMVFQFSCKVQISIYLFTFLQFYPVVSQDGKIHNSASSLFLLTITRSGRLDEIRWSVCISKSQWSLYVSFSRMAYGFFIYQILFIHTY